MHPTHSPTQPPRTMWRCATAVSSVGLPSTSPASTAPTLALAPHATNRTPTTVHPLDVALQPPAHVAGYVATHVAAVVAEGNRSTQRRSSATLALVCRSASDYIPVALRDHRRLLSAHLAHLLRYILRFATARKLHSQRIASRLNSAVLAQAHRLLSGNTPGVSSIHLRMHGGRLPLMMRNVAGIRAAESAVRLRMTVDPYIAMSTAQQAVIS